MLATTLMSSKLSDHAFTYLLPTAAFFLWDLNKRKRVMRNAAALRMMEPAYSLVFEATQC